MAALAIQAPQSVCLGFAPCTSSKRNGCGFSAGSPSDGYVHHPRLRCAANSFLSGSLPVDHLLKCETRSGDFGRSRAGGGVCRAAARFPFLRPKSGDKVKYELLEAIAPLSRGAEATTEDIARVDEIARELEKLNQTKQPLQSPLLNGKWKLIYTTSNSILKKTRPWILRPNGPIYQAINADTLRAQNLETWPYFNQVTANLEPVSESKVVVKFDFFKIAGLISIKAPGRARGELEVTYLDDELRISRGDRGNLFVLVMEDPDYRVPL